MAIGKLTDLIEKPGMVEEEKASAGGIWDQEAVFFSLSLELEQHLHHLSGQDYAEGDFAPLFTIPSTSADNRIRTANSLYAEMAFVGKRLTWGI